MAQENQLDATLLELAENSEILVGLRLKQKWFLAGYILTGTLAGAHRESTVSIRNHYKWLDKYENYRAAFYKCRKRVCDHVESSLVDRLVDGIKETVYFKGKPVGQKIRYDNATALRYLERVDRDTFAPSVSVDNNWTGKAIHPVDVEDVKRRLKIGEPVKDFEADIALTVQAMENCISPPDEGEAE